MRGYILRNAEDDLEVPIDCWEDCSVLNMEKILTRIQTILDVGGDCGKVCALSYCEFLDVLKSLGVAVVDFKAGTISESGSCPEQVFNPESIQGKVQAQVFSSGEPSWWSGFCSNVDGNKGNLGNIGTNEVPLDASSWNASTLEPENSAVGVLPAGSDSRTCLREIYSIIYSAQLVSVSIVFKIPNPDAKDSIVKATFNVNFASNSTASLPVTYADGERVEQPYIPVPLAQKIVADGSVCGGGDPGKSLITVTNTDGFLPKDPIEVVDLTTGACDGEPFSGAVVSVVSKTQLIVDLDVNDNNGVTADRVKVGMLLRIKPVGDDCLNQGP